MTDQATNTPSVLPALDRTGRGYAVRLPGTSLVAGYVETGPNMRGWGWTCGLGWHTGLPSLGAALDALLADPAFGVDVHGEGRPSPSAASTTPVLGDREGTCRACGQWRLGFIDPARGEWTCADCASQKDGSTPREDGA